MPAKIFERYILLCQNYKHQVYRRKIVADVEMPSEFAAWALMSVLDPEDHTIAEAMLLKACSNTDPQDVESHSSCRTDLLEVVVVVVVVKLQSVQMC